jgi:hypothetical protein
MIPLIDLAVGNANGRADLARRNQMEAEAVKKNPKGISSGSPGL